LLLGLVHRPKKNAKRLHLDEDSMDDDGDGCAGGAAATAESRYLRTFVYRFMFSCYALFYESSDKN
jgi:hypothetical protein